MYVCMYTPLLRAVLVPAAAAMSLGFRDQTTTSSVPLAAASLLHAVVLSRAHSVKLK